jgi:preprotein translocase subunit SecG
LLFFEGARVTFLVVALTVLFAIVSFLLIVIVLLQPHSGDGLAGAFGGGGGESVFGTKALTFASKVTVVLAVLFLVLAVAITKVPRKSKGKGADIDGQTQSVPAKTNETPSGGQK